VRCHHAQVNLHNTKHQKTTFVYCLFFFFLVGERGHYRHERCSGRTTPANRVAIDSTVGMQTHFLSLSLSLSLSLIHTPIGRCFLYRSALQRSTDLRNARQTRRFAREEAQSLLSNSVFFFFFALSLSTILINIGRNSNCNRIYAIQCQFAIIVVQQNILVMKADLKIFLKKKLNLNEFLNVATKKVDQTDRLFSMPSTCDDDEDDGGIGSGKYSQLSNVSFCYNF
jgi:hypothetical protein